MITVEKGHNPSDFTLVAYGGAGPLHAVHLAQEMGIHTVLIPPAPGALCALGSADGRHQKELCENRPHPLRPGDARAD